LSVEIPINDLCPDAVLPVLAQLPAGAALPNLAAASDATNIADTFNGRAVAALSLTLDSTVNASTAAEQVGVDVNTLEGGERVPDAALLVTGGADISGLEDGFLAPDSARGREDTLLLVGGEDERPLKRRRKNGLAHG
jgi:hypothetical protein